MKTLTILCVSIFLAACGALPSGEAKLAVTEPLRSKSVTLSAMTHPSRADEVPLRLEPASAVDSEFLEIFNGTEFKQWFAESFQPDTDIEPPVTLAEREAILKAVEYMADDRIDKAIKFLEKERTRTQSAQVEFNLAQFYFQQERFEEALALYEIATKKFPKFRRAWHFIGICQMRLGNIDAALPAFTRVINLGGGNALLYGLLGYGYTNQEKHLAAESAYRMAILFDPDSLEYEFGLANALYKQERFADAVSLFGSMLNEHPDRADLWMAQARCYIGMNQRMKAAEDLEILDLLGKSTAQTLFTLGDIYILEELYDQAASASTRAFELDPAAHQTRAIRATRDLTSRGAFAQAGDLLARIEDLRGAELSNEERIELLNLRARMAIAQGNGEEEAQRLEEIVALDPLDGRSLILLGRYHSRNDRPEEAEFYFERAAAVDEFEAEAKLRHGQHLVQEGKYAEALGLLRRSLELKPKAALESYVNEVELLAKSR